MTATFAGGRFGVDWWEVQTGRNDRFEAARLRTIAGVERARTLRDRARSDPWTGAALWTKAAAAARSVLGDAATTGDPSAQRLLAAIEEEQSESARKLGVAQRLAALEPCVADDRGAASLDMAYESAFLELGFSLDDGDPETLAANLGESPFAETLIIALDEWIEQRRRIATDKGSWHRLVDVAIRADADAWRGRLRRAARDDDRERLAALAQSERLKNEPAATWDLLAKALRRVGASGEAVAVYRRGHRRHPGDARLSHNLGNLLLGSSPPPLPEIAELFEAALAARPESVHYGCDLAATLNDLGRFDDAEAVLENVLARAPRYARAWLAKSVLGVSRGKFAEALEDIDAAIDSDRDYAKAHSNRGVVLSRLGRLKAAADAFRESIRIAPRFANAHLGLATVHIRTGDAANAVKHATIGCELAPESAHAHAELGLALSLSKRYAEAETSYRHALELAPENRAAFINLLENLTIRWRYDEALPRARSAVRLFPDSPQSHYWLGVVLTSTGQFEEGTAALERARDIAGDSHGLENSIDLWIENAHMMAERESQIDAALRDLESVSLFDRLRFAMTASALGRFATSARFYHSALEGVGLSPTAQDQRLAAARAAMAAAVGRGSEAAELDGESRRKWRRESAHLLGEWLEVAEISESEPENDAPLALLLADELFESTRDETAADAEEWAKIWTEIRDLVNR